jgi:hypothetical protein
MVFTSGISVSIGMPEPVIGLLALSRTGHLNVSCLL